MTQASLFDPDEVHAVMFWRTGDGDIGIEFLKGDGNYHRITLDMTTADNLQRWMGKMLEPDHAPCLFSINAEPRGWVTTEEDIE